MARNLLLDTGFWFALYYQRDNLHNEARRLAAKLLDVHNLVIPWPCLYETLNTRFVRRRAFLDQFATYLERSSTVLLSDNKYRERALASVMNGERFDQSISLVDEVIRLALQDQKNRIDAILTFNERDFRDICLSRNIELIMV